MVNSRSAKHHQPVLRNTRVNHISECIRKTRISLVVQHPRQLVLLLGTHLAARVCMAILFRECGNQHTHTHTRPNSKSVNESGGDKRFRVTSKMPNALWCLAASNIVSTARPKYQYANCRRSKTDSDMRWMIWIWLLAVILPKKKKC